MFPFLGCLPSILCHFTYSSHLACLYCTLWIGITYVDVGISNITGLYLNPYILQDAQVWQKGEEPQKYTNQFSCFHIVKIQYGVGSLHTALLLAVEDCQVPSVINSPGSTWAFTSLEIVSAILLCLIKLYWFVMYTGCYPLFLLFTLYFQNNYTMPYLLLEHFEVQVVLPQSS